MTHEHDDGHAAGAHFHADSGPYQWRACLRDDLDALEESVHEIRRRRNDDVEGLTRIDPLHEAGGQIVRHFQFVAGLLFELRCELVDDRLRELAPLRRQRNHAVVGQAVVHGFERGRDDVDAQHHPRAATVGLVVDLPCAQRRRVAVAEEPQVELPPEDGRDRALLGEPREGVRNRSEDVELQKALSRLVGLVEAALDNDCARVKVDYAHAGRHERQQKSGVEHEHVVRDSRRDVRDPPQQVAAVLDDVEADELEDVVLALGGRRERAILTVTDLSARYGRVTALHSVSVTVGQGEIVAVVGPNGAGKSTTLACITGVVRPSGGTVELEGQSLLGLAPERIARLTFFLGIGLRPSMAPAKESPGYPNTQ